MRHRPLNKKTLFFLLVCLILPCWLHSHSRKNDAYRLSIGGLEAGLFSLIKKDFSSGTGLNFELTRDSGSNKSEQVRGITYHPLSEKLFELTGKNLSAIFVYETSARPSSILRYYEVRMKEKGWEQVSLDPEVTIFRRAEKSCLLQLEREEQTTTIIVTHISGGGL